MPLTARGKGKRRNVEGAPRFWRRDDSDEGGGVVLPVQFIGGSAFDAAYSLPITIGSNNLSVTLQLDTGSSDLWVTGASCSTSSCSNVPSNQRYDPLSSTTASFSGIPFNLTYLKGQALGLVGWDSIDIGGYTIATQALAVASTVNAEPLSSSFNGIIGLALPDNSIIASQIPPTSSSAPDGAQFASNLFSLSPSSLIPAARFLSLTLERPGSSTIPSLFGIGKHPSADQVPQIGNGSNIHYSTPLSSLTDVGTSAGSLFWKAGIKDITVWVNSQARTIPLQKSSYESLPSAILDTGVPTILSTKVIADAIYGAIGVSPASDGNYYVDCKTPLNLTISLDGRPPISVHPLDLTTPPPSTQTSSSSCIGLIQAADSYLLGVADMILGVPFIRNTYMVLAYQVPNSDGSFPDLRPLTDDPQSPADPENNSQLVPRLGLQGLTNATVAIDEFNKVRVMGQPINGTPVLKSSDKKPNHVGLDVLFGLIGFFGLCFVLFGLRFCIMKRKYVRSGSSANGHGNLSRALGNASADAGGGGGLFAWFRPSKPKLDPISSDRKSLGNYELTGRHSPTAGRFPSEDALREMRYRAYVTKERMTSEYTVSSDHTRIGGGGGGDASDSEEGEMGWRKKAGRDSNEKALPPSQDAELAGGRTLTRDTDWDLAKDFDWNRDTLVGLDSSKHQKNVSMASVRGISMSPERRPMIHSRQISDAEVPRGSVAELLTMEFSGHGRGASISRPLLQLPETAVTFDDVQTTHERTGSSNMEFGESSGMAGIGSARRNERLRSESLDISGEMRSMKSSAVTVERPLSSFSANSERGRPSRSPTGPRSSTLSSKSSVQDEPR